MRLALRALLAGLWLFVASVLLVGSCVLLAWLRWGELP